MMGANMVCRIGFAKEWRTDEIHTAECGSGESGRGGGSEEDRENRAEYATTLLTR